MNIKPIITLDVDGNVQVVSKCLGVAKSMRYIVDRMVKDGVYENFGVYSVYTYGTENADKLEAKIQKEGFTVTGKGQVGPVIGSHVGPNVYATVFVRKE